MLNKLGGSAESVAAFNKALNKKITSIELTDDALTFTMEDGYRMRLRDEGQSCCENRYMRTDDNLPDFVGSTLLGAEVADAPSTSGEYGDEHEVQFLRVSTSSGVLVCSSHNEHNGYYGGFCICASEV